MKTFGVHGFDNEFATVTAINLSGLAGFQSLQYTDQAVINRIGKKESLCLVLFSDIGGRKIFFIGLPSSDALFSMFLISVSVSAPSKGCGI